MKEKWLEDEYELDPEDVTEDAKPRDAADALDEYNDEMARDAVGSLFDSERAPGKRVQDLIDEGEDVPPAPAPRRRDRTHEVNPVPRPAVKVAPTKERHYARPAPTRYERDEDYDEDDMEEEMDAFRSRYKAKTAAGAAPEGAKRAEAAPARPRAARRVERTEPKNEGVPRRERDPRYDREAPPPRRSDRLTYLDEPDEDDAERVPVMRLIYIGAVVILLGITVFFAYRVMDLSNQLEEANATIASMPEPNQFDASIAEGRVAELEDENTELKAEIARLESEGRAPQFGPDDTAAEPPGVTNPDDSANPSDGGTEGGEPAAPASQQHTAVSGDNLSKIAIKYYGSARPEFIQKIKDANNKTEDGVQIGEVLIIPPAE